MINWLKDGLNKLFVGDNNLTELSNKAVSFVSRYIEAGMELYIYDNNKKLNLTGSYAFTERDHLSNIYNLRGAIGQVALEN